MLQSIYVKDFILLEQINLNLNNGFSAFSGETGAGKSLLMDAIGILKGDRFTTSQIKYGKEKAMIEGVFDLEKHQNLKKQLIEAGYDIEDDLLIISRECNLDGKSKVRINHRISTVSFLKQIMNQLVDLHSQHDSQSLLNPKNHRSILDQFVRNDNLLTNIKKAYQEYHQIELNLNKMIEEQYDEDDLEEFTKELNLLNDINILEDELEQCSQQLQKMSAYEKITSEMALSIHTINKDQGVLELLYETIHNLTQAEIDEQLITIKQNLNDCYYTIEDQLDKLKNLKDSFEFDEYEYQKISDRITLIKKYYRKYGGYEGYKNRIQTLDQMINQIIHREDFIKKQQALLKEKQTIYLNYADQLHQLRIEKAQQLEVEVKKQLLDLCLPHALFHISIDKDHDSIYGYDQVIFKISMNPGESLKPLNESASGGELSRFMLGLKCVFTQAFDTTTIIFDEIDSGVSGSVAYAIGRKMKELSKYAQVFSVTHLAQVAACSHYHYHVSKTQEEHNTTTTIQLLEDKEARILELARISSATLSENALKQALELYEEASK